VVVDEERNKFVILKYDQIADKLNEPITMGETMRQYLSKLIDDLNLEWNEFSEVNVMTKIKEE